MTDLCSWAAAGLISEGEEVSRRAAMRCRCSINRGRDGRQASMAKFGIGLEEKKLVIHLWTLLQKVSSLSCMFRRGVNRLGPSRIGGSE